MAQNLPTAEEMYELLSEENKQRVKDAIKERLSKERGE